MTNEGTGGLRVNLELSRRLPMAITVRLILTGITAEGKQFSLNNNTLTELLHSINKLLKNMFLLHYSACSCIWCIR